MEFEIPTNISIVPGQLSVVFNEDVTEERARTLMKSMHYEILEVKFYPLQMIGGVAEQVSDRILDRLKREEEITDVEYYSTHDVFSTENPGSESSRYQIAATFTDGTTESQARKVLKKHLTLDYVKTTALPKEIVIQVGGSDEEAFSLLEHHKAVRWVTYVGIPETN